MGLVVWGAGSGSGADGKWSTAANWTADIKPVNGDDVRFDGTTANNLTLDEATADLNSLDFQAGYTGAFDGNGNDLTVSGNITHAMTSGTMNLGNGSTWYMDSGTWDTSAFSATWTVYRGILSCSGTSFLVGSPNGPKVLNVTSGTTTVQPGGMRVQSANAASTISNGATLHLTGTTQLSPGGVLVNNGTLTSDATLKRLVFTGGGGSATNNDTWTANTHLRRNATINAGTYGGTWTIDNDWAGVAMTMTFAGAVTFTGEGEIITSQAQLFTIDSQNNTITFEDGLTVAVNNGAGEIQINGNGADTPSWIFKGDLTLTETVGTVTWVKTAGGILFSGSNSQDVNFLGKAVEDITINKTGGTFSLTGGFTTDSVTVPNTDDPSVIIDFNDQSFSSGDMTFDGTGEVKCGTGTITCSGHFDNQHQATWTHETSTLIMSGSGKSITTAYANQIRNLTINDDTTVDSATTTSARIVATLTVAANKTLTLDGNLYGYSLDIVNNGEIAISSGKYLRTNYGSISPVGTFSGDGILYPWRNQTIAAGTFDVEVRFLGNLATTATLTLGTATFNKVVLFDADSTGEYVIANNTNDPSLEFKDDVTCDESGGGTLTWNKGTGGILHSGGNNVNVDYLSKAVEDIEIDKTAGDFVLTGNVETDSFTGTSTGTGDFDPNGKTITVVGNCNWLAAFDFDAAADCVNGCSWVVDGNWTADGQSLKATAGWSLEVAGTAVASGEGDVAYCDANGTHTQINASAGPWVNNNNNTNWNFGGGQVDVSGTIACSSSLTVLLNTVLVTSGILVDTSSIVGTLEIVAGLSCIIVTTSTFNITSIIVDISLSGVVTDTSLISGELNYIADLNGLIDVTSILTANLTPIYDFSGIISGISILSGSPQRNRQLSSDLGITGNTICSGEILLDIGLDCEISPTSIFFANINSDWQFASSIPGISVYAADLGGTFISETLYRDLYLSDLYVKRLDSSLVYVNTTNTYDQYVRSLHSMEFER